VKAIGLHAGRTSHPTVREFCCGHSPIEVKDIEKNTANFLKSLSEFISSKNRFQIPPPFAKGGKGDFESGFLRK